MAESKILYTLRPEDVEVDDSIPAVAVVVQYHNRQVHMVVDPRGENYDWAVAEFVREAKRHIRAMEEADAKAGA